MPRLEAVRVLDVIVHSIYLKLDILVVKLCGGAPHAYVDSEERRMPTLVEERIDSLE